MSEQDGFDMDMAGAIEGTDKASTPPFHWDYLKTYEGFFSEWRTQPINMFEIGVLGGASLNLWKHYFTQAKIVGIDIRPDCSRFANDRVAIEIGSQDDPEFLRRVSNKYPPTIIIDDGSHQADHIVYTFEQLFPTLLPGGVYVIEDLAFHFGPNADLFNKAQAPSATEYFLTLARSLMARNIVSGPSWGGPNYTFKFADSITFIRSAVVIRKKIEKDIDEALRFAAHYLDSTGRASDPDSRARLAEYVLANDGPIEIAETEIESAIHLAGNTARFLDFRSRLRLRQGRLDEAAADAREAAELSKNNRHYWKHLGRVERRRSDTAAAKRAFERAAELDPDDKSVVAEIAALNRATD